MISQKNIMAETQKTQEKVESGQKGRIGGQLEESYGLHYECLRIPQILLIWDLKNSGGPVSYPLKGCFISTREDMLLSFMFDIFHVLIS